MSRIPDRPDGDLTAARARVRAELDALFAAVASAPPDALAFDETLRAAGNRVVVHGAGNLGRSAVRLLRGAGIEPLALCDAAAEKWGHEIDGLVVQDPEGVAANLAPAAVVVAIWNLHHRFAETRDRWRAAGWPTVLAPSALRRRFADELLPFFAEGDRDGVLADRAAILDVLDVWADEMSLEHYAAQIAWRLTGDMGVLPAPRVPRRYFDEDVVPAAAARRYLDCGAYDGDTVQELLTRFGNAVEAIVAVEPDPGTFVRLQARLRAMNGLASGRVTSVQRAVGATAGVVAFNADGSEGAAVADDGATLVSCTTIDDLCGAEFQPTCIKMDIEGAEIDAIRGATATIERHAPALVVSLYHRQSDAWRIPALLRAQRGDYRLYCRSHENDGWEFDCYAVPAEPGASA